MLLADAAALAARIADALRPFCERLEIAGSVRRLRPVVNDLDLVCRVKPGELAALRHRVFERCQPVRDGDDLLTVRLRTGTQVDIYFTRGAERSLMGDHPSNWGSVLLCRTGSREHNLWFAAKVKAHGLHWNPQHGIFGPKGWSLKLPSDVRAGLVAHSRSSAICLASAEEADLYDCVGQDYLEPEAREHPPRRQTPPARPPAQPVPQPGPAPDGLCPLCGQPSSARSIYCLKHASEQATPQRYYGD